MKMIDLLHKKGSFYTNRKKLSLKEGKLRHLNSYQLQKLNMDRNTIIASTIITLIAIGSVGLVLGQQLSTVNSKLDFLNSSVAQFYDNTGFTQIANKISNSVVEILVPYAPTQSTQTGADYVDSNGNAWLIGTGFVIRDDGYILTAKHVVENSSAAFVVLENGTIIPALGYTSDNKLDIAIIKVSEKLPAVDLGNYDTVNVGSKVAFIGYPLFEPTQITHDGIVSFKGAINNLPAFTINSIVNHGNSGGPVFLENSGKVIGIITARQPLTNLQQTDIPQNVSYETQLILQNENKIISAFNENQQSGIGIAAPIDVSILTLLPAKQ